MCQKILDKLRLEVFFLLLEKTVVVGKFRILDRCWNMLLLFASPEIAFPTFSLYLGTIEN